MKFHINQTFTGSDPDRIVKLFVAELERTTKPMKKSTIRNPSKVPPKQWRKWSDRAKQVFNEVFLQMRTDQQLFLHPDARPLPLAQWKTTCFNAAWIAADAVDGQ